MLFSFALSESVHQYKSHFIGITHQYQFIHFSLENSSLSVYQSHFTSLTHQHQFIHIFRQKTHHCQFIKNNTSALAPQAKLPHSQKVTFLHQKAITSKFCYLSAFTKIIPVFYQHVELMLSYSFTLVQMNCGDRNAAYLYGEKQDV